MSGVLADRLEIWGIEGQDILFADGSLGFGIKLRPKDISCLGDDSINTYRTQLMTFLNGLPSEVDIQFIQSITPTPPEDLAAHLTNINPTALTISQDLAHRRVERLTHLNKEGALPKNELWLFVRKRSQGRSDIKPTFLSKSEQFQSITEHLLKHNRARLQTLREQVVEGLEALDLGPTDFSQRELLSLIYRQWNPDRSVDLREVDPEDLRAGLLFSDVTVSPKGFSIGNTSYRVLSLKLLPDQTFSGMAARLRALPFRSQLIMSTYIPDPQKEVSHLQTQRRLAGHVLRSVEILS